MAPRTRLSQPSCMTPLKPGWGSCQGGDQKTIRRRRRIYRGRDIRYGRRSEATLARAQAELCGSRPRCLAVRLVSAADKLHNARSILKDLRAEGEAAWRRFNAGREDQLWYYRTLVDALREAGGLEDLVEELDEVVGEIQQS